MSSWNKKNKLKLKLFYTMDKYREDAGLEVQEIEGEMTYVNMLLASQHNENVVYSVFNNHKKGDFKPYLFKSENKGKSWKSISSNLPERGSVYSIAEDHINSNLLFVVSE